MRTICFAISRIALRPSSWRTPAWLAAALHRHDEASHALARGDDLVAVAARLHHQAVFVILGDGLDAGARGRAADLLFRDEQEGDRQPGLLALPDEVAQRVIGDVAARLHVVDAGPEDAVALAPHLEVALDHADRMHRVEMGQHQDALALAPRRAALEDVAEAVAPRRAVELEAEIAELALDLVDRPRSPTWHRARGFRCSPTRRCPRAPPRRRSSVRSPFRPSLVLPKTTSS